MVAKKKAKAKKVFYIAVDTNCNWTSIFCSTIAKAQKEASLHIVGNDEHSHEVYICEVLQEAVSPQTVEFRPIT